MGKKKQPAGPKARVQNRAGASPEVLKLREVLYDFRYRSSQPPHAERGLQPHHVDGLAEFIASRIFGVHAETCVATEHGPDACDCGAEEAAVMLAPRPSDLPEVPAGPTPDDDIRLSDEELDAIVEENRVPTERGQP